MSVTIKDRGILIFAYVCTHALVREQVLLSYREVEVHDESLVSVIIRCRGLGGGRVMKLGLQTGVDMKKRMEATPWMVARLIG